MLHVWLASTKGSICSIRAWVLLMMNWLTHAIAWDLQCNNDHMLCTHAALYECSLLLLSAPINLAYKYNYFYSLVRNLLHFNELDLPHIQTNLHFPRVNNITNSKCSLENSNKFRQKYTTHQLLQIKIIIYFIKWFT